MVVFYAGFKYFRWGYRYPEFLRVLKDLFHETYVHSKSCLDEFGDMEWYDLIVVKQTKNGETTQIKPKYEYHDVEQKYPIVICGIPDGEYRVEGAFDEAGSPYFITVTKGSFDDKEMAIAGAYMWWCTQSNSPTGHTTLHVGCDDDYSYYHEGLCGELYHCHNNVEGVEFNLDTQTVCLETSMCC